MKSLSKDDFWSGWFGKKSKETNNKKVKSEEMDEIIDKIEELLDNKFKELSETNPNEQKTRKLVSSGQKNRHFRSFIYGYAVTMGPDGTPRIRQLGNNSTKLCPKKSKYGERRDLLIDVISSDDEIQIIMELPGVTKKEINVKGSPDHIVVDVDSLKFNYYKEIPMSCVIDPKSIKTKYVNGVLEINVKKAEKIVID